MDFAAAAWVGWIRKGRLRRRARGNKRRIKMTLQIGEGIVKRAMLCGAAMAVAWTCGWAEEAAAQNPTRRYSAGAQMGQQGGATPFASTYRRPAVSAYNQISNFSNNPQMAGNIYQQMVVPLQQQQQQQVEQLSINRQVNRLQNQVQQIQRDTSARQLDESIRPTGHRATYMNYSHYYQQ